jgi:hypothetical protein
MGVEGREDLFPDKEQTLNLMIVVPPELFALKDLDLMQDVLSLPGRFFLYNFYSLDCILSS